MLRYAVLSSYTKMLKYGNSRARKLKKESKCKKYYSLLIYWRKERKVVEMQYKKCILFM